MRRSISKGIPLSAVAFSLAMHLCAQEKADEGQTEKLQKATQNPVASLISVPIQNIDNFNIGPASRTQNVLNIQPVVPMRVSEDWNLILRWITPIISQPVPTFGLGPSAVVLVQPGHWRIGALANNVWSVQARGVARL